MLTQILKKILGFDILEKRVRVLERKNYWREKYKHGLPKRKHTSDIL
tara:strand:- start:2116 stop:2256 length:141 start_codon:yes stop_codon:yes gene_type:complete